MLGTGTLPLHLLARDPHCGLKIPDDLLESQCALHARQNLIAILAS